MCLGPIYFGVGFMADFHAPTAGAQREIAVRAE
jgi:hypothetical protein